MPGGRDEVREPTDSVQSDPGGRKFTWQELSKLNERHNAHVAVRGKVRWERSCTHVNLTREGHTSVTSVYPNCRCMT